LIGTAYFFPFGENAASDKIGGRKDRANRLIRA